MATSTTALTNNVRNFPKNAFNKSLKWNFFTFIFGFLTILIMLVINIWLKEYPFFKELNKQVQELVFLYFAIGITMSIALDFFFIKNKKKEKYSSYIYIFAAAIFFFGAIIITLSRLHSAGKLPEFDNENQTIQYFILFCSVVYSIFVKAFMFLIEK